MKNAFDESRRKLIAVTGLALADVLVAPAVIIRRAHAEEPESMTKKPDHHESEGEEGVTPPEDLMREHGVLDRVLLIYEAVMQKFGSNEDFDPAVINDSANIVREFIEDYHEKLEEEQVFPRFSGKMDCLVGILLDQHRAGRRVTDVILKVGPTSSKDDDARRQVVAAMQAFITMYRPHAAREDTVLFPRLRGLVSANEYDAMAEDFEKKEHALFGDDGFETMVHRVAAIEQALGIWDISQFTAR